MGNLSDLSNSIIFELKSLIGRKVLKPIPRLFSSENYLNLGCGGNILSGYINADFYFFKFWNRPDHNLQWQLDLRYPHHCEANVFSGVYCEHTIEHLKKEQSDNLFRELFRVMKSGAYIRIGVPDLNKYIQFYRNELQGKTCDEFSKRFQNGCEAFSSLTQEHGYQSVWNNVELVNSLLSAGFIEAEEMASMCSHDAKLQIDTPDRSWETLYVEAKKP